MSTSEIPTIKRALLIGINKYLYLPLFELQGCLNDVKLFREVLTSQFRFLDANITELTSPGNQKDWPTRERILSAFDKLISDTQRGDIVVIQYSGHGSRNFVTTGTGYEETIVPCDAQNSSGDITDKEIQAKLVELANKLPSSTTLIFDSCHSGSITRNVHTRTRRMPPYGERQKKEEIDWIAKEVKRLPISGFSRGGNESPYTLFAGCRDTETCKEFQPKECSGEPDRPFYGAFTWNLCQALKNTQNASVEINYLRTQIEKQISLCGITDQSPEVIGISNQALFGSEFIKVNPYVTSTHYDNDSNMVVLSAGAVNGMAMKSIWNIYENPYSTQNPVAQVKISKVGAVRSWATIEAQSRELKYPCYAFLHQQNYDQFRMPVYLDIPQPLVDNSWFKVLQTKLSESNDVFMLVSDRNLSGTVTVSLLQVREKVDSTSRFQELGKLTVETWVIQNFSERVCYEPLEGHKHEEVFLALRQLASAYLVSMIESNPGTLDGKIEVEFFKNGIALPSSSTLNYEEGDFLDFEIRNQYHTDIWVGILVINEINEVKLRGDGASHIAPTRTLRFSSVVNTTINNPKHRLNILPRAAKLISTFSSAEEQYITVKVKILITTSHPDYSSFNYISRSSAHNTQARANCRIPQRVNLSNLMWLAFTGCGSRDIPMGEQPEYWVALEQVIAIRPSQAAHSWANKSPYNSTWEDQTFTLYQGGLMYPRGEAILFLASHGVEETLVVEKFVSSETKLNIVFVHGLFGNENSTWTNNKGEFWPNWLTQDLQSITNIYSLRHRGTHGNVGIDTIAKESIQKLDSCTSMRSKPIIFVCHSLGGIVVKKMLCLSPTLMERTLGIVFYATPHDGSILANWLVRFSIFKWRSTTAEDLQIHCSTLIWLHHQFTTLIKEKVGGLRVTSLIETRPLQQTVLKPIIVVAKESALLIGGTSVETPHDHISICKPLERGDIAYQHLLQFIHDLLNMN